MLVQVCQMGPDNNIYLRKNNIVMIQAIGYRLLDTKALP